MIQPEVAANWYATRLHYSEDLTALDVDRHDRGREGHALCSTERSIVEVYDEPAHQWYWERSGYKGKSFDGLPLCKKCEKKLAARLAVSQ